MSYECYDQGGEKISRVGKASIQRVLMSPVDVACGDRDFASVWCEDAEVYISRHGKNQRQCEFHVSWWEDGEEKNAPYEYKHRETAIKRFLALRAKAIKNETRPETTIYGNGY
jgi:hypothetical protein